MNLNTLTAIEYACYASTVLSGVCLLSGIAVGRASKKDKKVYVKQPSGIFRITYTYTPIGMNKELNDQLDTRIPNNLKLRRTEEGFVVAQSKKDFNEAIRQKLRIERNHHDVKNIDCIPIESIEVSTLRPANQMNSALNQYEEELIDEYRQAGITEGDIINLERVAA